MMKLSNRLPTNSDVSAARPQQPGGVVTLPTRVVGYTVAAWSLGFAAVSGWQLISGQEPNGELAAYSDGIAIMIILVGVLKILGAVIALLAIQSRPLRVSPSLVAIGLWGAAGVLAVYSAGNIMFTIGGLVEPSAAWESAGGVTPRSALYVLFFLVGAILFGILAASFHRRHDTPRAAAVIGLLGAPLLLGVVLVIAPALLSSLDLLPL